MFNPIKETFRNIFKEKRLFFSSFLSLIVVFVLLDKELFMLKQWHKKRLQIFKGNYYR